MKPIIRALAIVALLTGCGTSFTEPSERSTPEASGGEVASAAPSVEGHLYVGPSSGERVPGCEGCGNPATFEFGPGGRVELAGAGSDILESGSYVQEGARVVVTSEAGTRQALTLSDDGAALVDADGTRYARR
ncbi:MAG: hypothetical protein R3B82_16310 [Sandaracinaceae bacterium]